MAISDFLDLDTLSPDDLVSALKVVRAFKHCESQEEWVEIPFMAWAKLEQLEEYLEHLVEGKPLKEDTLEYIERMKKERQ